MDVKDKTLAFDRDLWVQYGGVEVAEDGRRVVLTGRDEEGYLKVFNHFGRLLKLYVFEGGRWLDADTGGAPQRLDESQAGHLPATPPQRSRSTAASGMDATKPGGKKDAGARRATKAAPTKKDAAKAASGSPAKRKAGAGKATTGSRGKRA